MNPPEDKSPSDEPPASPHEPSAADDSTASSADASPPPAASTSPGEKKQTKQAKKQKPEPTTALGKFWAWASPIVKVVVVVWLVRTAIIDWNDVPTGSMEPTIEVGDRILVNKMAYALQLPLSGPKLGVPFTGLQWDNPLDFLPQFQWGTPRRFDIVTFWNPVSGRRMVKRIVAEPGDTIQMRGGVLTINGETANYTDVTPTDQTPTTRLQSGGNAGAEGIGSQFQTVPLEYLQETLLGAERTIQHIKVRWLDTPVLAVFANGAMATLNDEGRLVVDPSGRTMTPEEFAATEKTSYQLLQVRAGATFVDGEPASYNDYAEAYLKPLAGQPITLSSGEVIEIDGHELVLNNQTVSHEVFLRALQAEFPGGRLDRGTTAGQLYLRMDHLGKVLLTSFGPVTLDEGQYYMVGDNRNNSHDSRFFGPVHRGEITGEAFAVAASFNGRILQLPPDPDWGRWFMDID